MIDNLPAVYYLETLEQVRAVADELRVRIATALSQRAMTVKQVATMLGEAPAKVHYHVSELERVGIIRLVETREKGGILEKYYRTVAQSIQVSPALLRSVSADDAITTISEVLQRLNQSFLRAMTHAMTTTESDPFLVFTMDHFWMTKEEGQRILEQIQELLKPYEQPRDLSGEEERSVHIIVYTTQDGREDEMLVPMPPVPPIPPIQAIPIPPIPPVPPSHPIPTPPQAPPVPPKMTMTAAAGVITYGRDDLEAVVAQGRQLAIHVLGYCRFARDIPADLAERAIARFQCIGRFDASPEVREVLLRKKEPQ